VPRYAFEYDKSKASRVKLVAGAKGGLWITDTGLLISRRNKSICKVLISNTGYYRFCYNFPGKYINVVIHRAVATAFIPNPENKPQVNHIDGVKTNNHYTNLEWATNSENIIHAYRTGLSKWSKLSKQDVLKMLDLYNRQKFTILKISDTFNISARAVNAITVGNNFKDIYEEYHAKYRYKYVKAKQPRTVDYKNRKFSLEQAIEIVKTKKELGLSNKNIAKMFNCSKNQVGYICSGFYYPEALRAYNKSLGI
jgi:hypothetical protein